MNRSYVFGGGSFSHIATTTDEMQALCLMALKVSNERYLYCPDWGVTCGKRTAQDQFARYLLGRVQNHESFEYEIYDKSKVVTYCDGYKNRSNHQAGDAVDIYVAEGDRYSLSGLSFVFSCFVEAARRLNFHEKGLVVVWGGNYESFCDAPHIEIIRL